MLKKLLLFFVVALSTSAMAQTRTISIQLDLSDSASAQSFVHGDVEMIPHFGWDFGMVVTLVSGDTISDGVEYYAMDSLGNNLWGLDFIVPDAMVSDSMWLDFETNSWGAEADDIDSTMTCVGHWGERYVINLADGDVAQYCYASCTRCDGSPATTDIDEFTAALDFSVFPNPASQVLNVDLSHYQGQATLIIKNLLGQEIMREAVVANRTDNRHRLQIGDLPTGAYLVEIQMDLVQVTRKFVKR